MGKSGIAFLFSLSLPSEKVDARFWSKNKKYEVTDKEIREIKDELGIEGYPYQELKGVLNKEINPEESPDLTYGVAILTTIEEMKIVDSIPGGAWSQNKLIDRYFDKMSEVNLWAQETRFLSEKILGEASGIIRTTILMLPKFLEVGIDFKMLAKTYKSKVFWWYFRERFEGTNNNEAFMLALEVGCYPVGGLPGIYLTPKKELTKKGEVVKGSAGDRTS